MSEECKHLRRLQDAHFEGAKEIAALHNEIQRLKSENERLKEENKKLKQGIIDDNKIKVVLMPKDLYEQFKEKE